MRATRKPKSPRRTTHDNAHEAYRSLPPPGRGVRVERGETNGVLPSEEAIAALPDGAGPGCWCARLLGGEWGGARRDVAAIARAASGSAGDRGNPGTSAAVRAEGVVGEWATVSVPTGTFRALKVSLQTELFDPSTGEHITGADVSWYVPEVRRSVKSLTTGKGGSQRLIQLLRYELGANP